MHKWPDVKSLAKAPVSSPGGPLHQATLIACQVSSKLASPSSAKCSANAPALSSSRPLPVPLRRWPGPVPLPSPMPKTSSYRLRNLANEVDVRDAVGGTMESAACSMPRPESQPLEALGGFPAVSLLHGLEVPNVSMSFLHLPCARRLGLCLGQ